MLTDLSIKLESLESDDALNDYKNAKTALEYLKTLDDPDCTIRDALIDNAINATFDSYDEYTALIAANYAEIAQNHPEYLAYSNPDPIYSRRTFDAIIAIRSHRYSRDDLSNLLLSYSLCPMHAIDFAICFDDDDPECAQIRQIFPYSHDT